MSPVFSEDFEGSVRSKTLQGLRKIDKHEGGGHQDRRFVKTETSQSLLLSRERTWRSAQGVKNVWGVRDPIFHDSRGFAMSGVAVDAQSPYPDLGSWVPIIPGSNPKASTSTIFLTCMIGHRLANQRACL